MSQSGSSRFERVSIIYYAKVSIYITVFDPTAIKKTIKRVRFSNQLLVLEWFYWAWLHI